jgi:hypothetical protein
VKINNINYIKMPTRSCSPKPKRKSSCPPKPNRKASSKKTSCATTKTQSKNIVKIEGKNYSVKRVKGVYVIDKVA